MIFDNKTKTNFRRKVNEIHCFKMNYFEICFDA